MNYWTLFLCLIVLAALAERVWALSVKSKWLRELNHAGTDSEEKRIGSEKLDLDSTWAQPFSASRALLAGGVIALVFLYCVVVLCNFAARTHLSKWLRIIPETYQYAGLKAEPGTTPATDLSDVLKDDKGKTNRAALTYAHRFTSSNDPELNSSETLKHLAWYIEFEAEFVASEALGRTIRKLSGEHNDEELRKLLSKSIEDSLTPWMLDSESPDFFFKSLGKTSKDSRVQQVVKDHVSDNPGNQLVLYAIHKRIAEKVAKHRRVQSLFWGVIQFITLALFFTALILLRGRAEVAAKQEADLNHLARLGSLIGLTNEATSPMLLYPTRLRSRIQDVLGCAPMKVNLDEARELAHETTERNERRLDRLEYSHLHYLLSAMPSFGFIGTVFGISAALSSADKVVSAIGVEEQASAISGVTSVLGLAFDTTLVALVATIPIHYLISTIRTRESRVLLNTDRELAQALEAVILEQPGENQ